MLLNEKYYRFDTYFEEVMIDYYKDGNHKKTKYHKKVAIEIKHTHKTPEEKIKAAQDNDIDIYEFDVNEFKKIYKKTHNKDFKIFDLRNKENFNEFTKGLAKDLKNKEFFIEEITSNFLKKIK